MRNILDANVGKGIYKGMTILLRMKTIMSLYSQGTTI